MQLNENYDSVMIIQKNSGIGISTWARFFKAGHADRYHEIEVTDLDTW